MRSLETQGIDPEIMLHFLKQPTSYPHQPDHVRVIQTHASYVALVPPFVYKVKKPLNLGFLDFSTLDKQHHYCDEEVRLNRRLAPEIYEGVVPIVRIEGHLAFGTSETPVAYAVKMKQLTDGYFLNQLIGGEQVTATHIERLVDTLYRFYTAQKPDPKIAEWGRIDALKLSTDENVEQTKPFIGDLISQPAFKAISAYIQRMYTQQYRLINQRRAEGRVLDCHGDLHLDHIHIKPENINIYDCIEFSERLRYIDVANDIAFLAMDLDHVGRSDLAHEVTWRIAERLDDPGLLDMLDLYKCYRAYVRGKVESIKSTEPEVSMDACAISRGEAIAYYQQALHYAVIGSGPFVLILMGGVGTGKSTQAQALGEALGWAVISSDRVRKEQAGEPLYQRRDDASRHALYSTLRTEATYTTLIEEAQARAEQGLGTILDATFGREAYRTTLRYALRRQGIPYCFVELKAPEAQIKRRLAARTENDEVISDARLEDWNMLQERYEVPDALEDTFHLICSSEIETEQLTFEILDRVSQLNMHEYGKQIRTHAGESGLMMAEKYIPDSI